MFILDERKVQRKKYVHCQIQILMFKATTLDFIIIIIINFRSTCILSSSLASPPTHVVGEFNDLKK